MRRCWLALFLLSAVLAQNPEDSRGEVILSSWLTSARGTFQSGERPIDLHSDLRLEDSASLFGKAVLRPWNRHRFILEGAPYRFDGRNTLSRAITFQGVTYSIQDPVSSRAEMNYVFGGYQFDLVTGRQGHAGVQVGGAFIDATGTLTSVRTGLSATRNERIGLPLLGGDFRVFPIRGSSLLSISGDVKGMSFGGYGRFVQAGVHLGAGSKHFRARAGYQWLDADIHEKNGGANPIGIAPNIRGPIFGAELRF